MTLNFLPPRGGMKEDMTFKAELSMWMACGSLPIALHFLFGPRLRPQKDTYGRAPSSKTELPSLCSCGGNSTVDVG